MCIFLLVHYGVWDWCNVGSMQQVYYIFSHSLWWCLILRSYDLANPSAPSAWTHHGGIFPGQITQHDQSIHFKSSLGPQQPIYGIYTLDTINIWHGFVVLYYVVHGCALFWGSLLHWSCDSYRQIPNISRNKSQKLKCFSSRIAFVFAQSIEAMYQVENVDVVGAAPTGDAPTTSEW